MGKVTGILDCQKGIDRRLGNLLVGDIFPADTAPFINFRTVCRLKCRWLPIDDFIRHIIRIHRADNRAQHEEYGNPSDQYQCQENDDNAAEYPSTALA